MDCRKEVLMNNNLWDRRSDGSSLVEKFSNFFEVNALTMCGYCPRIIERSSLISLRYPLVKSNNAHLYLISQSI